MSEAPRSTSRPRGGRSWLLVTAWLSALLLVLSGWSSHARVVEATRTLERGQAEALLTTARARFSEGDRAPTHDELETLVTEGRASGVRFIAVVRRDGTVLAQGGEEIAPVSLPASSDDLTLEEHGKLVRVVFVPRGPRPLPLVSARPQLGGPTSSAIPRLEAPPPPGPAFGPPPDPRFGPPPGAPPPPPAWRGDAPPLPQPPDGSAQAPATPPGPPGAPPPLGECIVIDFEPVVADALAAGALRAFLASGAAALVIVAAAFVFWWQLGEREKARERMERERHLASLGEMSAVLAHEIKNPLTALKGHAQLLCEQLEPGGRPHKKAERIVAAAKRLEDLSTTLLDFVRSAEVQREEVAIEPLFARVVEEVAPDRVDVDVSAAPASFRLDGLRMEQVVANLLRNALEASPPDARVSLSASTRQGRLEIAVADRGPGVPEAERERIFEPFHTARARGTGLGLSVSRRIVEMHGGTLEVIDRPGGGALFRASIPR